MSHGDVDKERLAQLSEENEDLRKAARTFGELAERLMKELQAERRRTARIELGGRRRSNSAGQIPVA